MIDFAPPSVPLEPEVKHVKRIAIFLFWNKAQGKQASLAFSPDLKHVNTIVFDGHDWIMLDFGRDGFIMRRIDMNDSGRFINFMKRKPEIASIISVQIDAPKKIAWKLYMVRTCNEFARYATGVDVGLTFNPVHLYNKLIKYDRKRNYHVLSAWRRENYGFWWWQRR